MPELVRPSGPVVDFSSGEANSTLPTKTGFCRLAEIYNSLEKLMFGYELERARFCWLAQLSNCRDILLLGEGDGRCLEQLVRIAPQARLHCVDASAGMLRRAAMRLNASDREQVAFECANILEWSPSGRSYDAVVTLFFLDCLSETEVRQLVGKLQPALQPNARWLWADFVLPNRGLRRWRAQVWLWAMYQFFRHSAQLHTRALPPTEEILRQTGWRPVASRQFQRVFALSVLFSQPGCDS